jgi:hypothetical protein
MPPQHVHGCPEHSRRRVWAFVRSVQSSGSFISLFGIPEIAQFKYFLCGHLFPINSPEGTHNYSFVQAFEADARMIFGLTNNSTIKVVKKDEDYLEDMIEMFTFALLNYKFR